MALTFPVLASQLAQDLGAQRFGDDIEVHRLSSLVDARSGCLSFYADPRYKRQLQGCQASVILVGEYHPHVKACQLVVDDPEADFFALAEGVEFKPHYPPGIHASAVVEAGAEVDASASIGPLVVVEAGAKIGAGAVLLAQSYVAAGCEIGDGVVLHPGAKILAGSQIGARSVIYAGAVIGARGFGYRWDGLRHKKEPQLGRVIIESDVEIGANSCVDRAALGETFIGRGTCIDNLVQVGHGVRIGAHAVIAAQSGLAGSAVIGTRVMMGGQVGVADHANVGAHTMVAAQSGISGRVQGGQVVAGTPATPLRRWRRAMVALNRLPEILVRLRRLEGGERKLESARDDGDGGQS